jgi:hypothetical protein
MARAGHAGAGGVEDRGMTAHTVDVLAVMDRDAGDADRFRAGFLLHETVCERSAESNAARAAVAELIEAVNDYAQSYMVDEAEDPDVCGSESQHQQARRVMDALANIGAKP